MLLVTDTIAQPVCSKKLSISLFRAILTFFMIPVHEYSVTLEFPNGMKFLTEGKNSSHQMRTCAITLHTLYRGM